jgi:hypothetical protein
MMPTRAPLARVLVSIEALLLLLLVGSLAWLKLPGVHKPRQSPSTVQVPTIVQETIEGRLKSAGVVPGDSIVSPADRAVPEVAASAQGDPPAPAAPETERGKGSQTTTTEEPRADKAAEPEPGAPPTGEGPASEPPTTPPALASGSPSAATGDTGSAKVDSLAQTLGTGSPPIPPEVERTGTSIRWTRPTDPDGDEIARYELRLFLAAEDTEPVLRWEVDDTRVSRETISESLVSHGIQARDIYVSVRASDARGVWSESSAKCRVLIQ